jgi:hypothetical protein
VVRLLARRSVWLILGIGFVATMALQGEAAALTYRCTRWTGTGPFCQPDYSCPSGYKRQVSYTNCITGFKVRCCRRLR